MRKIPKPVRRRGERVVREAQTPVTPDAEQQRIDRGGYNPADGGE